MQATIKFCIQAHLPKALLIKEVKKPFNGISFVSLYSRPVNLYFYLNNDC
jgi:hypothetical protein